MTTHETGLVQHSPDLWTLHHPLRLGIIEMGTRSTLVRLASGKLVIHSPVPVTPQSREAIDELGEVAAIVAPNLFHHFYFAESAKAWPEAALYLAPGLAEKQKKLPAGESLSEEPPALWRGELEQHCVGGTPLMGEVVFFHPGSRTLMLTDLCFNLGAVDGLMSRTLLRLMDAHDRFGPSRMARVLFTRDKAALRASIGRILEWDFDRITVTHGEVVESGGYELFEAAWRGV